jgi:hypothetical protein
MTREELIKLAMQACEETWNEKTCKQIREALEQEPTYYPPCIDCNKKMDEIRCAYDKLKEQELSGDAISRQAVLDLISNFILEIHSEGGRDLNAHTNDVLRQILRNIGSDRVLPSVKQEPKIGHWIKGLHGFKCSKCLIVHSRTSIYCPSCGAKMIE